MTKKQAQKQAKQIAEIYGARLIKVKSDNGMWIAYFEEHGDRFCCELSEE